MSRCVLLLSLLWSLVEVSSQQTFPNVSFMGQTLANHSYVDLSLVGEDVWGSDSVKCHTDLAHVVVYIRVAIVETGISLLEIDCNSLIEMVISLSNVKLRELAYVVGTVPPHQLVSIAVRFQLKLSIMMIMT